MASGMPFHHSSSDFVSAVALVVVGSRLSCVRRAFVFGDEASVPEVLRLVTFPKAAILGCSFDGSLVNSLCSAGCSQYLLSTVCRLGSGDAEGLPLFIASLCFSQKCAWTGAVNRTDHAWTGAPTSFVHLRQGFRNN